MSGVLRKDCGEACPFCGLCHDRGSEDGLTAEDRLRNDAADHSCDFLPGNIKSCIVILKDGLNGQISCRDDVTDIEITGGRQDCNGAAFELHPVRSRQ